MIIVVTNADGHYGLVVDPDGRVSGNIEVPDEVVDGEYTDEAASWWAHLPKKVVR